MPLKERNPFIPGPRVRLWLLLAGLIVLIAVACFYLIPTSKTKFSAKTHTPKLEFSLGDWPGNAGIFNSNSQRVSMVLGQVMVEADDGSFAQCDSGAQLGNVKLSSLPTVAGEDVTLSAGEDGYLHFLLALPPAADGIFVIVKFDEKSDLRNFPCLKTKSQKDGGELRISALTGHDANPQGSRNLRFRVKFALPQDEPNIPIIDGSAMDVYGQEGPCGSPGELVIHPGERKIELEQGFIIEGLQGGKIHWLHYEPDGNYIDVDVRGTARSIRAGGAEQTLTQDRIRLEWGPLADWAVAVATFLLAGVTFYQITVEIQRENNKSKEVAALDAKQATQTASREPAKYRGRKKR
jgi:hypothetical protein